jgi:hypothetical protein
MEHFGGLVAPITYIAVKRLHGGRREVDLTPEG